MFFQTFYFEDPLHDGETVIVIQSLVPGGVAQADGRIVPGDRLLFVNDLDLSNSRSDIRFYNSHLLNSRRTSYFKQLR